MPVDKERIRSLAERINRTSNADFVKRLRDRNRAVLHNEDGTVSTHELGYVTEGDHAVVFPDVQSVGDSLSRFPFPESYERAVERGDTVHMSVPDAELFTKGYKDVYPGFHEYKKGGVKGAIRDAAIRIWFNKNIRPKIEELGIDEVRRRLYNHISPVGYSDAPERIKKALDDQTAYFDTRFHNDYRDDIWATYLSIPKEQRHAISKGAQVVQSPYKPTVGATDGNSYYKIDFIPKEIKESLIADAEGIPYGVIGPTNKHLGYNEPLDIGNNRESLALGQYFGTHTISRGVDPNRGEYVSYYDLWDIAPVGRRGLQDQTQGIGNPINFYDRIYLDDYFGVDSRPGAGEYYGGYLQPATVISSRKNGGPLHQFYAGGDTEPNKWDRISNARYKMANSALLRGGAEKVDADRLARFLAAQSALEAGWVDDVRGHNYAGYMSNGKRMTFDNADSFWDYHLKNMDEKWPGWRQADSIDAYYNIINHPELGLDTKEKYDAYNRKHRDAPVYLYAPAWENENYLGKLRGVYNKYINRYVTPMACGGKMHKYDGDSEPSQEVKRGGIIGSLLRSLGDSGVRDAKIGAVGAQQVRDLYASGQDELASKLADAYKDAAVMGVVNAATAGVLPYADALAATRAGKAATHALKTLAKPANALSDQGASLATLADALGFVSGVSGLANDAENAIHGNYHWSDVPETLLDATVFVPGASQITDVRNLDNLSEAGKTLANIPNITSRNTFLNRVFHPVETYRFSDLSRKAKDVLPDDVYEQALSDLSNAYLYNAPNLLPGAQPGYSFLDRSPSLGQMYYYRDPNTGYVEIAALGDEMAKNDFSRGHELGHLVADSAESLGYEIGNYPKRGYNYNGAADTEQVIGENFADIFGNSITRDAHTDIAPGFMKKRYPYIQGEKPVLNKTKTERKPLTIDDIPDSNVKKGLLSDMQNLQKAIDLNEDKSIIEYYERRVKMWKDKLGLK